MTKVKIYHPVEMVDIVDQDDHVIGQTSKIKAHAEDLLHRCVLGQVIDTKGRWLLVRQSVGRQDPGQYILPIGGHVQSREDILVALAREAEEELGFNSNFEQEYAGKFIYKRDVLNRHENHYFIIYKVYSNQRPKINHESD